MPIPKLALLNGIFLCFSSKLVVVYYEHISHRQSILILKADFCIFAFVCDEAII